MLTQANVVVGILNSTFEAFPPPIRYEATKFLVESIHKEVFMAEVFPTQRLHPVVKKIVEEYTKGTIVLASAP